ncbi:MAG: hypothetical protein HOV96_39880 [Nonomuraea sp.]|nr:hypothetical protein [Nonomuraea sp.]NUP65165.1 hypothetical protein [Nonomuraea sp.]NUP83703.1 hypothetical protein [Nonomuraea sp.]NUR92805.1 hypothetical protein [Nonomuraea sp.]NUS07341.1 hypothetical protein [Nonomuraea sp.]
MLTDEVPRRRPHEAHLRGVRPAKPAEEPAPAPAEAPRNVHRLRRIRQVSVQAISEIDQALA